MTHRPTSFSSSSTPTASPAPTSNVGDNGVENDDCVGTPYVQPLGGPGSCPAPALRPANTDSASSSSSTSSICELEDSDGESDACRLTLFHQAPGGPGSSPSRESSSAETATTFSARDAETETHAAAGVSERNGGNNTSATAGDGGSINVNAIAERKQHDRDGDKRDESASSTTTPLPLEATAASDVPDAPTSTPVDRDVDGRGNSRTNTDQTSSSAASPRRTDNDVTDGPADANQDANVKHDRTRSGRRVKIHLASSKAKRVLKVGDKLVGPLISSDGKSSVWPTPHGYIFFANNPGGDGKASAASRKNRQEPGLARPSEMVAADARRVFRVLQARAEVRKEQRDGTLPTEGRANGGRSAWGWVSSMHTRHQKLLRTTRRHLGEVEMTLDERGCVVSCLLEVWLGISG